MDSQRVPRSGWGSAQNLDARKPRESSGPGQLMIVAEISQGSWACPLFPTYLLSLPPNHHHPGSTPS